MAAAAAAVGNGGKGGVLLLHGHGRSGASMQAIALALRAAGLPTRAPSWGYFRTLSAMLDQLAPAVARFERRLVGPMHIVTHSLGGLVARAMIARDRPQRLGRVVMLAPPNGGSELADALQRWNLAEPLLGPVAPLLTTARPAGLATMLGTVDYPLGIIAGSRGSPLIPPAILPPPNDGRVRVAATRLEGMADHVVLPVGHATMLLDPRVLALTLRFLETGAFGKAGAAAAQP